MGYGILCLRQKSVAKYPKQKNKVEKIINNKNLFSEILKKAIKLLCKL